MTHAAPLAAALIALTLPAQAMDGRYKLTEAAQCLADNDDGILRIEEGVLYGAESRCRMTNPLEVRAMDAMLYDMVCIGEGTGWEERALLMRAASGGLILLWDGYAFEYDACPGTTARPKPRTADAGPAAPATLKVERTAPPPPRPTSGPTARVD